MYLTPIGMVLALLAVGLLVAGSRLAMFSLFLLCSLMGGAAAIVVPALGGSSIPPIHFMLPFLVLRIVLGDRSSLSALSIAVKELVPLAAFVAYGVAAAFVGPRIFARAMDVPPLRFRSSGYLFEATPLLPAAQNITTSIYLVGTLLAALCTFVICQSERGARTLVRTAVALAWIHIFLGLTDLMFGNTAYGALLQLFRNGSYAQLDQSFGDFVRIKGIFPEASGYAGFGVVWFVFLCECWFRNVSAKATGSAAVALGVVLLFSTSGTAYVGLSGYAGLVLVRTLIMPQSVQARHVAALMMAGIMAAIVFGGALVLLPKLSSAFGEMISHMTLDKSGSRSGLQRLFWARKGFEAFSVSSGLGIGPGSFRSSSLLTAILGSCGVIGAVTFTIHILRVLKPLRASTYLGAADPRTDTGIAATWATLAGLIPLSIAAASCDPGFTFAILSGAALSLRSMRGAVAAPSGVFAGDIKFQRPPGAPEQQVVG